ncbi:hypothetical protein J1605_009320 [Eschrichtius robustus]|uniref:Ras GTPase-activating protein 3 n=1 Tax=Eschrichtius robustus TaxID=9764 RepID=A0AB34GVQ4_ESCRO|nr:hypothetical protein J1605_009320 [Eschrichtius robustus]
MPAGWSYLAGLVAGCLPAGEGKAGKTGTQPCRRLGGLDASVAVSATRGLGSPRGGIRVVGSPCQCRRSRAEVAGLRPCLPQTQTHRDAWAELPTPARGLRRVSEHSPEQTVRPIWDTAPPSTFSFSFFGNSACCQRRARWAGSFFNSLGSEPGGWTRVDATQGHVSPVCDRSPRAPAACGPPVTPCHCHFQGKVHLELRLSEVITDSGVVCHKLATRTKELTPCEPAVQMEGDRPPSGETDKVAAGQLSSWRCVGDTASEASPADPKAGEATGGSWGIKATVGMFCRGGDFVALPRPARTGKVESLRAGQARGQRGDGAIELGVIRVSTSPVESLILECQGLPIVNGQCDPYATVTLAGPCRQVQPRLGGGRGRIPHSGKQVSQTRVSEAKKTKVKKKTNNPQFDEVFYFEVTRPCSYNRKSHFDFEDEDVDKLEIRVDLWNASNLKFGDEFLGELRVPLKVLRQSSPHEAWYFLQPRDNGSKSLKPEDLGSLRLNVVYTEDHVFSSDYYSPLRDLLLRSADVEPVSASAAHILGEVCREKQEAAVPLVRLFLHYGRVVPFISAIASAEVRRTQDPNTIFRGNSLTSKCIDETMKLAGMHYLHVTLKPTIEEICQSHKSCEIDPVRLKDGESLESNTVRPGSPSGALDAATPGMVGGGGRLSCSGVGGAPPGASHHLPCSAPGLRLPPPVTGTLPWENLRQYVDRVFSVITKSGVSCPTVMCDIFFSLREAAAKRFQDDLDVRYTAVSSFIFLRFFAPAILSPNLFQLTPHHTDPQTSRTLTLVSKTIQTLGSLSKSKSASFKESYMAAFYEFFNEQKYADAVKNFLDLISSSGRRDPKSVQQPILLKEGFMIKRAQGRKRFGMKNFKKRWFRLTNHEFTYQKSKGDPPLYGIPIENILAVEPLEEESFKMKNAPGAPVPLRVTRSRLTDPEESGLPPGADRPPASFPVCLALPAPRGGLVSDGAGDAALSAGGVPDDHRGARRGKYPGSSRELLRSVRATMFQVIQPERALYIQANNCVEAKAWIDILTKVSQCNQKRLAVYHPSAYLNGHWLCCRASSDTAAGCSPCTSGLPADIQLDIDGDRETERIYSLFSSYMSKLEKMQGEAGRTGVNPGGRQGLRGVVVYSADGENVSAGEADARRAGGGKLFDPALGLALLRAAVRDSVVGPAAPSEGAWKQACWTLFLFVSWSVVGHSLEGTLAMPW